MRRLLHNIAHHNIKEIARFSSDLIICLNPFTVMWNKREIITINPFSLQSVVIIFRKNYAKVAKLSKKSFLIHSQFALQGDRSLETPIFRTTYSYEMCVTRVYYPSFIIYDILFRRRDMLNKTPDDTLRRFLVDKVPDYIPHVPDHWLDEHMLSFHIQVSLAILFLMICIPGNFGHLLVFIAYSR